MAEWGHTSAAAAEVSALDTRRPKVGPVEHSDDLRERWRTEAAEHGWPLERLTAALTVPDRPCSPRPRPARAARLPVRTTSCRVCTPGHEICTRRSRAVRRGVARGVRRVSCPEGLTGTGHVRPSRRHPTPDRPPPRRRPADGQGAADRYLDRREVVYLGADQVCGDRYSTVDLLVLERGLAEQVAIRQLTERSPVVKPSIASSTFVERPSMTQEQRVSGVRGVLHPGRGQRRRRRARDRQDVCLDSARDAFQRAGYTTIGCALSASAAHQLQQGSGIWSNTIARLQHDLDRRHRLGPHVRARRRRGSAWSAPATRHAPRPRRRRWREGRARR